MGDGQFFFSCPIFLLSYIICSHANFRMRLYFILNKSCVHLGLESTLMLFKFLCVGLFIISLFCYHITNIPQRVLQISSLLSLLLFHISFARPSSHIHTKLLVIQLSCIILTSLTCIQKSTCKSEI
jgi:hypothetical protein